MRRLVSLAGLGDNTAMNIPQLELTDRPLVMGVLNVTPDSFSDGGQFADPAAALAHAGQMVRKGADIIDIGGESTRPGARPVSSAEQIERTQSVIGAIREEFPETHVSIDTRSAEVAAAAVAAGACMVNDISALRADLDMACRVAEAGAYVVLMHMQGKPTTMQVHPLYDDMVSEIEAFLHERIEFAVSCGIAREKIILDPGIGFGKTTAHNLRILANLNRFTELGPVLLGASRKSFIGKILGIDDPQRRLTGTIVTNTIGLLAGVRILRVHDVKEARQTVDLCQAFGLGVTPTSDFVSGTTATNASGLQSRADQ